ncbi:beta/gamma crystallin domain-containing protein [Massilia glaciei]|nr:beta/gamma crystallin domain-containing protein [Massilia glaciei]
MHTKHISRLTLLAMLAAVPAFGVADGMGAGQASDTTRQPADTTRQPGATSMGGSAAAGQTGAAAGRATVPTAVFMLVPIDVAAKDNSMRSGCWARIHSANNYAGDTLVLTGPLSLADMSGPFGLNWDDRVDSVEMGPKATLTVYDNERFEDLVGQFKPGQKVPDISKKMGFFDEFASVRLTCTK